MKREVGGHLFHFDLRKKCVYYVGCRSEIITVQSRTNQRWKVENHLIKQKKIVKFLFIK